MRIPAFLTFPWICISLVCVPMHAFARPVIDEVAWAGSDLSSSDEWVELTSVEFDSGISGYLLTSVNTSGQETVVSQFPSGTFLPVGETLLVAHYAAGSSRLVTEPNVVSSSTTLPNSKLLLRLRDVSGNIVDQADDGVGAPMAGSNQTTPMLKASMQRVPLSGCGALAENWTTAVTSFGLEESLLNFGTPGVIVVSNFSSSSHSLSTASSSEASSTESSIASSFSSASSVESSSSSSQSAHCEDLRITELLPDPVGDDAGEWIEFQNRGAENLDVSSCSYKLAVGTSSKNIAFHVEPLQMLNYVVLHYPEIGLHLPNAGTTVSLQYGDELLNSIAYSAAVEGVSYGILNDDETGPQCIPSPGIASGAPWLPTLEIESGSPVGVEHVTMNVKIGPGNGTLASAQCTVDFGDGHTSTSCNPGVHSYNSVGQFLLSAEAKNYCGTTVQQSMEISVSQTSSSSKASSAPMEHSESSASSSRASLLWSSDDRVVFDAVLPNPKGTDDGNEWMAIRNPTAHELSLAGLLVRASNGKTHGLSGIIAAGATLKIYTASIGLSLKNSSEELLLEDPNGNVLSSIAWTEATEGIAYRPVPRSDSVLLQVMNVVDGDTFNASVLDGSSELYGREVTVRLLGVDAPETVHPTKKVQPFGREVSNYLKALLKDKKIELQFDTKKVDYYGRWLGYVQLDGTEVQQDLLSKGLVRADEKYSYEKKQLYLELQSLAQEKELGLWSATTKKNATRTGSSASSSSTQTRQNKILVDRVTAIPTYSLVSYKDLSLSQWAKPEYIDVISAEHQSTDIPEEETGSLVWNSLDELLVPQTLAQESHVSSPRLGGSSLAFPMLSTALLCAVFFILKRKIWGGT